MTNFEWNEEDVRRMKYDSDTWENLLKSYKKKWQMITSTVFLSMFVLGFLETYNWVWIWIICLIISSYKWGMPPENPYNNLNTNPKYLRKIGKDKEANKYAEASLGIDEVEK